MKFAHKSGIVWKIYLIKLYICNANYPSIMFWIKPACHFNSTLPQFQHVSLIDVNLNIERVKFK
jgi:hypothetical protein